MNIQIHNPSNLPLIDYRTIKPLQGKLKKLKPENYEKLKNVLTTRGFRVPLFLWHEELPNIYWLMDGHGRQKVMMSENMTPYEVPYVLIDAANIKEAKAQLLEITSQYQTITKEGFAEFTLELEAHELEAITFDALDFKTTTPVRRQKSRSIVVTFGDESQLEDCLVDIQDVCEKYSSAQIKVNE